MLAGARPNCHFLWNDFAENLYDPKPANLMRRISAIRLADIVTKSELCFCTNVSTELNEGTYLRRDTDLPKGVFGNFLTSRRRSALSYPHVWALQVKHCCTGQS